MNEVCLSSTLWYILAVGFVAIFLASMQFYVFANRTLRRAWASRPIVDRPKQMCPDCDTMGLLVAVYHCPQCNEEWEGRE